MRRKYTRLGAGFVLALALALVAATVTPGQAKAGTSTATFTYNGSGFQKRTIIDTGSRLHRRLRDRRRSRHLLPR